MGKSAAFSAQWAISHKRKKALYYLINDSIE